MKLILVPTDFSKCAGNAMEHALALAKETGAGILVLHVVFPNEGVDNNIYNVFWSDEYMAERVKGLENWVRKYTREPEFKKVPVQTECQIGFPVPAICDTAEDRNADLIVMGTTGATGLRGAFLGSIAAGVLSKTKCPLLSIPKQATLAPAANAVFATDFRFKLDDASIAVLREIMNLKKSKLHIVHILDKPGQEQDSARENAIRQKLGDIPNDFHYLHDRDITQAVSNFIESIDAGTLVAIAHEHSLLHRLFFDSITRRMAHRIHVPMLTLHDAA
ncbi:MAG: universal stress protein [Bacteroidetes bacterium]|nr:MAG: universal stress protein [Bacteroidota bacterium]